jgi:hypothetical protein
VAEHYFAAHSPANRRGCGQDGSDRSLAHPKRVPGRSSPFSSIKSSSCPSAQSLSETGEAEGQSYGVDCLKVELRVAEQCQLDLPAESDDVRLVEEELVGS